MLAEDSVREILGATLVALVAYLALLVWRLARLPKETPGRVDAGSAADASTTAPPVAPAPPPPPAVASTGPQAAATVATRGGSRRPVVPMPAATPPPAATPAPQNVSPVHDEAAGLARQGLDAATIARRCGITLSEAELVCWLARNQEPS